MERFTVSSGVVGFTSHTGMHYNTKTSTNYYSITRFKKLMRPCILDANIIIKIPNY